MNNPNEKEVCKNCDDCPNKKKEDTPIRQIETDYVSDIRNHIAPTTVVIEK